MSKLGSKNWWIQVGERAAKTFGQSVLSMVTVGQAVMDVNWINVLSVSALAAALSVMTSVATIKEE